MKEMPKEKLIELADKHIALYAGRVEQQRVGRPGWKNINVEETAAYLGLWTDAKQRMLAGEELTPPQLGEIQDAIESGDYDELLGMS
jgi:hypothetical protein